MKYCVTIGIPVFKSKDYIVKTMESALSQSFKSIEFLVVDDCGEDGSMEIIQCFQNKHPRGNDIHILKNSRNYGVSFCRNKIIDNAQGDYLFFLDSDDVIESHAIQLLYDSILRYCADVAFSSYDIIDNIENSPIEVYQKESLVIAEDDELAIYAFKNNKIFHISVCNCLMNLFFLRQTGIRFINAKFWEDLVFTYELVPCVKRAVLFSDITYHYLLRENSLSHYQERNNIERREIENNVETINYIKNKCKKHKGKRYLSYMCYNLEVNSFYMICYILKNYRSVFPKVSIQEMQNIITHPLLLKDILKFKNKFLPNFLFWVLGNIPIAIFYPLILLLAKLKRAI